MNSFMLSSSIFLLAFIIIYPLIGMAKKFEQEHFSEDECRNAGFSNSLKCSACELLLNFGLEEILSDCLQCCSKEVKEIEHDKYAYAEMQICECNLHRFPQIAAFVRGKLKDQWGSRLRINHVKGVLPTIVLTNSEDGEHKLHTQNVESWDTDTLSEFLNDWLLES